MILASAATSPSAAPPREPPGCSSGAAPHCSENDSHSDRICARAETVSRRFQPLDKTTAQTGILPGRPRPVHCNLAVHLMRNSIVSAPKLNAIVFEKPFLQTYMLFMRDVTRPAIPDTNPSCCLTVSLCPCVPTLVLTRRLPLRLLRSHNLCPLPITPSTTSKPC